MNKKQIIAPYFILYANTKIKKIFIEIFHEKEEVGKLYWNGKDSYKLKLNKGYRIDKEGRYFK